MFVVYSSRQMLPVIREVEYDSNFSYRVFEDDIDGRQLKSKDVYYAEILDEIDEEYVKQHTSD